MTLRALHDRDTRITFDPEVHKYYIDDQGGYTSVTETLKRYFPPFDKDNIIGILLRGKEKGSTYQAIAAKWKAAADFGTLVHNCIENWLLTTIWPQACDVHTDQTIAANVEICKAQFMNFWTYLNTLHGGIANFRPEIRIFDEVAKIAGSVDLLIEFNDGSLEIIDWKCIPTLRVDDDWGRYGYEPFGKYPDTNYWHYVVQLNTYMHILETHYGLTITGLNLVQFHPILDTWKMTHVPKIHDDIKIAFDHIHEPVTRAEPIVIEMDPESTPPRRLLRLGPGKSLLSSSKSSR